MDTIKSIIKAIRQELGLTQREFAVIVNSTRNNIAKYETGLSMPPANVYQRILDARDNKGGTQ